MWGHANYFADKSQYSNSYRFNVPGTNKAQMFIASICTGKHIELQPDRTLKMPPLVPGSTDKFDSVKGNTGGSDVFMAYSNKKCYPSYLVTYTQQ